MSSTVEIIFRSVIVAAILLLLPGLPWPNIDLVLPYLAQLFDYFWLLNPIFDIPLLFSLGKLILLLQLILAAKYLIMGVAHFITSGTFYTQIKSPPGEGGIGSGETGI